jgi:hypothetical protein
MHDDLQDILRQLDTLMSLRASKDEATTLIVEALHRMNDKINASTIKVGSGGPVAGTAPKVVK